MQLAPRRPDEPAEDEDQYGCPDQQRHVHRARHLVRECRTEMRREPDRGTENEIEQRRRVVLAATVSAARNRVLVDHLLRVGEVLAEVVADVMPDLVGIPRRNGEQQHQQPRRNDRVGVESEGAGTGTQQRHPIVAYQ